MTAPDLHRSPCPTCGSRDHYNVTIGRRPLAPECLAALLGALVEQLRRAA